MLLILSPSSAASDNVLDEVTVAKRQASRSSLFASNPADLPLRLARPFSSSMRLATMLTR